MLPNSYDYNEVVRIFGATPKFEMFRSTPDELLQMVEDMFSVHDPNRIHCFRIKTKAPGMLKLMIMLPYLFNETSIRKVIRFLEDVSITAVWNGNRIRRRKMQTPPRNPDRS
ncbi:MAG: hypothetical protein Ct9H90mP8_3640 [Pseudomonadota bacterium]|nr:MAG: hypothetical protein Ct9H90mP8_3640 [Pseudomonadota bacterium]